MAGLAFVAKIAILVRMVHVVMVGLVLASSEGHVTDIAPQLRLFLVGVKTCTFAGTYAREMPI